MTTSTGLTAEQLAAEEDAAWDEHVRRQARAERRWRQISAELAGTAAPESTDRAVTR